MPGMSGWRESLKSFRKPSVITMLFLGFSAGIPILLIFSSLSLWLREAGISRATTTFFSWAALGYSFKFVWAPIIDRIPVPIVTKLLGRRRAWLLIAQLAVILSIVGMAMVNPANGEKAIIWMALAAVALGFASATQDIVIDAYRIESAEQELQALLSATYIAGYRVAMIVAGAGAIWLADIFGSTAESYQYLAWRDTYLIMASCMVIGVITTLIVSEPDIYQPKTPSLQSRDYLGFLVLFALAVGGLITAYAYSADVALSLKTQITELLGNKALASVLVESFRLGLAILVAYLITRTGIRLSIVKDTVVRETYVEPVTDFFRRYGLRLAWMILLLVGLYRISDIVLGVISNVFYQDLGFSKTEIAQAVKTFGLVMTIAGGFLGGLFAVRFGVLRILLLGAILAAATNLLFMWLAAVGYNLSLLYLVVAADNISAGLASAAFVAFLSSLTNVTFTAMQYALFSSLMTLVPKSLGGYSGSMVDQLGYPHFFLITALMGIPVILLIWFNRQKIENYTTQFGQHNDD